MEEKPRWHWLRFNLGTLLIAVVLLLTVSAWWGVARPLRWIHLRHAAQKDLEWWPPKEPWHPKPAPGPRNNPLGSKFYKCRTWTGRVIVHPHGNPDIAPDLLPMFGEKGVRVLCRERRSPWTLDQLKGLFPESAIIELEQSAPIEVEEGAKVMVEAPGT